MCWNAELEKFYKPLKEALIKKVKETPNPSGVGSYNGKKKREWLSSFATAAKASNLMHKDRKI